MSSEKVLFSGFLNSAEQFPERPALEVEGRTLTYRELKDSATALAATLAEAAPRQPPPLTAVFAYRSATAFAGVLAALLRGHGYVPLNRTFPVERTRYMLAKSGCRELIVDAQSETQLEQVLQGLPAQFLILLPHRERVDDLRQRWPQHHFAGQRQFASPTTWAAPDAASDDAAYLLFTSGSTGTPKGVLVRQRNVRAYLDYVLPRYGITEQDRCSQMFDMTFDLSVHDMFVTWEKGACLCCPSQKALIKPGDFIKKAGLTTWFSVPSTPVFMKKLGALKPGMFPGIRLSLFCGEALPVEVAGHWASACPNSIVENIYGPTELTIACTAYRWNAQTSPAESHLGIVPIGGPFDGMEALVVNEELHEVASGQDGELLMTGPQLSAGYYEDEEKTRRAFVVPPGQNGVFYRTGDRVRRSMPGQPMVYLGRVDNQIKILGHRVELGEVEAVVRNESGVDGVVAVGWPIVPGGAGGIEVFLQAEVFDICNLSERLAALLPTYMCPRRIHLLPQFPVNANGKFDRKELTQLLGKMP